jgi:hypothetical protein
MSGIAEGSTQWLLGSMPSRTDGVTAGADKQPNLAALLALPFDSTTTEGNKE